MPSLSKGIKELYIKLGSDYSIISVDSENVINRHIGMYEILVYGVDNNKKSFNASVHVRNRRKNEITEVIHNVKTVTQLKNTLNELVTKYAKLSKHREFLVSYQFKI